MTPVQLSIFNSVLFFQRAENYMVKWYSLFWCGILAWRSCHFGKSEIHLKHLLSPTPQPCCYIKESYTYDNAFPWWWGITEDIVTMKKQAAVKTASALTTLPGLDFSTLKTIWLLPRCGTDSLSRGRQLTLPHTSQKGPVFLLVTHSVTHITEWD